MFHCHDPRPRGLLLSGGADEETVVTGAQRLGRGGVRQAVLTQRSRQVTGGSDFSATGRE